MDDSKTILLEAALRVIKNSYSPYSRFPVAASILTARERVFSGINIENACYSLGYCAEASAIGQMVGEGEKAIKEVLVLSQSEQPCSPCGGCRQRLYEFGDKDTLVHLCQGHKVVQTVSLGELLPFGFNKTVLT